MRRCRLAALLLAIGAGCVGPSYVLKLKPYQLDAVDFPFASGLRILFQEDHSQPSVLVASIVDVGSSAEPPGKEGMAHLIEHLCFRAVHGSNPKVMDQVKQLGGVFNASTTQDWTDYFTLAPKDALLPLLEIEAKRMIDPLAGVTEEDLKIEREVVRNELRLRIENDVGKAYELASEMVYPEGHVYHRSVIGSHESLANITMADIQAFVNKWYRPENVTIVVAGDFDRAQAKQLIPKAFPASLLADPADGKIALKPERTPRIQGPSPEPPPPADRTFKKLKGPVTNPVVVLAWSLPGGYRSNEPLIQITASSMSGAIGSMLYPETEHEDDRKIEGLGCGADTSRVASTVYCFIELVEGQEPEKIADKALDGLWELWNSDNEEMEFSIGEDAVKLPGQRKQFAIAKAGWLAELFRQSASLWRAVEIAHYMHFTGRPDMFSSNMRDVSAITSYDSRELAFKYLRRERAVRLVVEPYDQKEKPAATIAFDQGSGWAGASFGTGKGVADFTRLTPAQVEALAIAPDSRAIRELTLENGLKVLMKRHGSAPFVQVALYTGGAEATAEPWGFPRFAFEDFDAKDPGQIAAAWTGWSYSDGSVTGVDAPSGNLHAALDLVADQVTTTKSHWSRRRFDKAVEALKRRRKVEEKRPDIWARRARMNLLLPGHPLAHVQHDFEAIGKLTAADYDRWLARTLAPKNATLLVVGDVDYGEAERLVRQTFSPWRTTDPGSPVAGLPPPPSRPARQIALLDDPEATQSGVVVACHLRPATPTNDAARDVLTGLLREDLWSAIRERAGASYGVGVGASYYSGGTSLLTIGSQVQNDKTPPALRTILDRIREVRAGKVEAAKLNEAKWSVAAASRTENQSIDEMSMTLLSLVRDGRPLNDLDGYPKRLAAVTLPDLADLLEPCAGHEVVTVIGPQKALQPELEKMSIPIETVDWRKGSDAKPNVETKSAAVN